MGFVPAAWTENRGAAADGLYCERQPTNRGGPALEPVQLAAILGGAALLASMVSVEAGISVALVELALGVGLGNVFNLDPNASWLSFIAGFASVVLTFLAGAEVDPDDFRERFGASIAIGIVSFLGPFLAATLLALGPLGWSTEAALIAGTALSTTSLAVVYAVLVETGLNQTLIGKRLMAATFVTDLATVTALSVLFLTPTIWILPFALVSRSRRPHPGSSPATATG